jgi:hypothetical protein
MNKTLSTILIVIAVLVLAGVFFIAGGMYSRANAYGPAMMFADGNRDNAAYSPGMMTGRGGSGMMNGIMGGYGWRSGTAPDAGTLTVDEAKAAAEEYLQSINLQGLETGEVMIFDNNAYVVVKESETGLGAFELLVDPASQVAYPEHGPNMMWNLKYSGLNHSQMMGGSGGYGMMGGMMSGSGGMMGGSGAMMDGWEYQATPSASVSAEMTVTPEEAIQYAQEYLNANDAGAVAADDPTQFYGYYTLDFSKDGRILGMLSVNGYNGQIFLHTWHGTFIEEAE